MTQIPPTKKSEFIFSLCRLKKDCHYPPVSVDFNPILRPNQTFQMIYPSFKNDQKYYTPAFVNPYSESLAKGLAHQCEKDEKEKFFKKVQGYLSKPEQNSPCFDPKDDRYCSLCGISFDDYWKHITTPLHHRKVKHSQGDKLIRDLCEQFCPPTHLQNEKDGSRGCMKKKKEKKIKKEVKQKKGRKKGKKSKNEDLIIKLPRNLFEREDRALNFNLSTNGVSLMKSFQTKE